jgi:translation initiation factor IF-2
MAVINSTRLNKAARELNVGTGTIVEFLHKKGFDIDPSPNTKLTPEMYDLLTEEYKGEKTVKEEARKLGIGTVKRESISIKDRKPEEVEYDDSEDEDDIIIRGVTVEVNENFRKSLDSHHKDEKPAPIEIPTIEIIEPVLPPVEVYIEPTVVEPEMTEVISEKAKAEPESGKTDEIIHIPEEKTVIELPIEVVAPVESESKVPVPETRQEPEIIHEPEIVIAVEPEVVEQERLTQPKIVGRIDLSTINERTKPAKKSQDEKRKEREDRRLAEKQKKTPPEQKVVEEEKTFTRPITKIRVPHPEKETAKPEIKPPVEATKVEVKAETPKPDNFLKTTFEKLQGVSIVGRIDLPEKKKIEKKDPVASSSDDKVKPKKKKRRRIRKTLAEQQQQQQQQKPPQTGAQKPSDNRPKTAASPIKAKRPKREEKHEPTEEEIQKQIKETLARLSGGGKSKTSKHRRQKRDLIHKQREKEILETEESKHTIKVTEFVTANELASMMNVPVTNVISMCMQLGLAVSINQRLDAETISLVAEEFGFLVEFASADNIDDTEVIVDDPADLVLKAPIVTVMGHVDHGKTKLLDYIRHTNVIAGEAGGITQHIGAYEVALENGKKITFLDTPGHEAFTAMRARGAKITDVAIIVIAADDSVMPQTKEAINHALAANVPIVFAINKVDKATANPEKIKEQLSHLNILVEDWGGKYQSQEISAKAGTGIETLLDKVLLEAEMLDLKANPSRRATGTIIESSLDKGRGYVAKLLVQNGTLKNGDIVLAGSHYGKVKAMYNERNQLIKEAGPATPLLILGINGAPQAGDIFKVMEDEREAKTIASKRMQLQREQGLRTQKHITLDEIGRRIAIGDFKELNIIVKGDVDGSVEALSDSLLKLSTEEVQVNVIHKSVGAVTESDVLLASASNAIIIGFQVRPSLGARRLAEREQIDIRLYSIIYAAIEEIKSAIEGMLAPEIEEKIICNIEVRETFKITKVGTIAGCMVLDGSITRNTTIRIIRDGIVIHTGKLGSLKRFKDDAREVNAGYECGLNIDKFDDIRVGDIIEGFEQKSVARKLN